MFGSYHNSFATNQFIIRISIILNSGKPVLLNILNKKKYTTFLPLLCPPLLHYYAFECTLYSMTITPTYIIRSPYIFYKTEYKRVQYIKLTIPHFENVV